MLGAPKHLPVPVSRVFKVNIHFFIKDLSVFYAFPASLLYFLIKCGFSMQLSAETVIG